MGGRMSIGLPKGMSRDEAYIAGVADGEKQERERIRAQWTDLKHKKVPIAMNIEKLLIDSVDAILAEPTPTHTCCGMCGT